MLKNIKIIKTGIDPEPFLKKIRDNPNDWDWVSSLNPDTIGGEKDPYGFLPLIWAKVPKGGDPKNTDAVERTPLFEHYPEVINFWQKNKISNIARAAFFRLLPEGTVERHIDDGTYYLTKDRYHLSLQSTYHYTVGNEEMIVEPGTFFWFHNKIPHGAKNIGNVDRISLVFDVPHNKKNPHHKVKTIKGFG